MTLDGVALRIGQEIARHAARAWLNIHREQDRRGRELVDLLEVAVTDTFRRRELAR